MKRCPHVTPVGTLLSVALAVPARHLSGQQVVGTVRDSASGRPVPGAVVLALDSLGQTVARGTTDQLGHYRLPASAAPQRLRVLRIGFRPLESARLAGRAGRPVDLSLAAIPLLLDEVRVSAAPNCSKRADRAAALALLGQARAGLLATVVARAENRARMTRLVFERSLDRRDGRITQQSVRVAEGDVAAGSFVTARDAATFVRRGFVEDNADGRTFFAPDAETLFDDRFSAGYCFHLVAPNRARPHQVGLGFAAATRRTGRVDIAGALWVDTLALALRDLEFRYAGLEPEVAALAPGGRVSFREMTNGNVLIDRWALRLVSGQLPARNTWDSGLRTPTGAGLAQLDLHEIGGELARATWPDGSTWVAPLGALRVRVVGAGAGPAAGAVVRLADTDYQATTDSAGLVTLTGLLPGPYTASVVDSQLAWLGISLPTGFRFVAARDSRTDASLRLETAEHFVERRCAAVPTGIGGAWLLARVVRADGRPAADARWTARTWDGAVLVDHGRAAGDGVFQWCGFAPGTTVEIEAWQEDRRARATRLLRGQLTTLRLELPRR